MSRIGGVSLLLATGCVPHLYTSGDGVIQDWVAPDNSWQMSEPPARLKGEGYEPGQVVPDFRLLDQHGDEVSLWQFYGQVVLLDISTMWCAPCRELAESTEATWTEYRDQGFMYLTVLQEDVDGNPPTAENLNEWADAYGITSPVLNDAGAEGTGNATLDGVFPAVLVIDRELVVAEKVNPPTEDQVHSAIGDAL